MVELKFIKTVMDSCANEDQKQTAYNWINDLYNKALLSKSDLYDLLDYLKLKQ